MIKSDFNVADPESWLDLANHHSAQSQLSLDNPRLANAHLMIAASYKRLFMLAEARLANAD